MAKMKFISNQISGLISVVIPITHYEQELEDALSSVFSQTYENFQVVLVDNLATEGTRAIAKNWRDRYSDRVRIVREEIRGAVSARNRGIQESQGEFIALLDSDDRMKSDRLEVQLKTIKQDEKIVLVGSWYDELSPDGKSIIEKDVKPSNPRWWKILFGETPRGKKDPFYEPQTSTFFFRSEMAHRIGLFDQKFDPFWLEDTDFSFRMYEKGKVKIVPQSLVQYRTHLKSDSIRRIFDFGMIQKHNIFFDVLREKYYHKDDPISQRAFLKLKSRWLRETGIKVLAYQNGEDAGKKLIRKALLHDILDIQNLEAFIRTLLPSSYYPKPFRIKDSVELSLPEDIESDWFDKLFLL